MIAKCDSTPAKYCQAVCQGIAIILSRNLFIGLFGVKTAYITQSTRPNQGFPPFCGTVIFTRQVLDARKRQPKIR